MDQRRAILSPNAFDDQNEITRRMFLILLLTVWAVVFALTIFDLVLGAYPPVISHGLGLFVLSPLAYGIYRLGRLTLATHLFIATGSFYILSGHLLHHRAAGFDLYLFPALVLAVLMFRADDYRNIAIAIGTILTATAIMSLAPDGLLAKWSPPDYPNALMHSINFASSYALIILFVAAHTHSTRKLRASQLDEVQRKNTHLRSALERIAEDERNLNEMFEGMLEGVRVEDLEGHVVRQNHAARALYAPEHEMPRVFTLEGQELTADEWPARTVARTGRPEVGINLRVVYKDGSARLLIVSARPLTSGLQTGFTQVLTTLMDVSDQRKSEALFQLVVNSTPDWMFIKDRQHRYLMVNNAYALSLGRKPAEMIGRDDLELGFPEAYVKGDPAQDIRGFWTDDDLVFRTNRSQTFDNDPVVIDGDHKIFHTVKAPLVELGGTHVYGVIGICRDITQLKDVERQLLGSSKMASLGQMAGGIAHEINNPLAIIHGKTSLLARQLDAASLKPEALREGLQKISATVERIAKIIRGLKTFARSGEDDPFELLSVGDLVQDALALCSDRFRNHGLAVEMPAVPDLHVHGNAAQLAQVLINFLNNAFDAIETLETRWVRIEVLPDEGERTVEIAVVDSGTGLSPKVAAKIAQPFFTTKSVGRGTGLGLTISRRIIERHRGKLFLDTAAANTRFVIRLRLAANATSVGSEDAA